MKLLIKAFTTLVSFLALTNSALSANIITAQINTKSTNNIKNDVELLVFGNNTFACNLYRQVRSTQKGNLFLSPYSISIALAMTSAGAKGETSQEINKVLNFQLDQTRLHPAFKQLINNVESSENNKNQLHTANRLWVQKGLTVLDSFAAIALKNYAANPQEIDFNINPESARQTINNWISQKTYNKITDIIRKGIIDASTQIILTNAIYFKSAWEIPFDPKLTKEEMFTIAPGKQVNVPMMYQKNTGIFGYNKFDDLQVLEIFYAEGKLSMVILLPEKIDGLADIESQLTGEKLQKWLHFSSGIYQATKLEVWLPKFKISSEFDLKNTLTNMGLPLIFSKTGDLSGINGNKGLWISTILHKAFVEVNEQGTEAGAATMGGGTRGKVKEVIFRVDRPFIFLIRDIESNSILFLGRVVNPVSL